MMTKQELDKQLVKVCESGYPDINKIQECHIIRCDYGQKQKYCCTTSRTNGRLLGLPRGTPSDLSKSLTVGKIMWYTTNAIK